MSLPDPSESRSGGRWDVRFAGWHMIVEAATKREAQAIANRNVGSFGGVVGVDRPHVCPATDDDVNEYLAMGGAA